MTIQEWLKENGACREAREWAEGKTWPEIYATCPFSGWLKWLFFYTNPDDFNLWCKANKAFEDSLHIQQTTITDWCNAVRSVLTFEAFNTPWEEVKNDG